MRGSSLVEVFVAMAIVSTALLALAAASTSVSTTSSRTYRRSLAKQLAARRITEISVGSQKDKLRDAARDVASAVPDASPADCDEAFGAGNLGGLCDGSDPDASGWVDVYGRPCLRTGASADGFHPTCYFRRYVRFTQEVGSGAQGDLWRVSVVVSHAPDGTCVNFNEGDHQCVVANAVLSQ